MITKFKFTFTLQYMRCGINMIASLYNICLIKKKKNLLRMGNISNMSLLLHIGLWRYKSRVPYLVSVYTLVHSSKNDYVAIIDLRNDSTSSTTSFKMYNVMLN